MRNRNAAGRQRMTWSMASRRLALLATGLSLIHGALALDLRDCVHEMQPAPAKSAAISNLVGASQDVGNVTVMEVSGDYSRGAAGFWVEGGVIRQPVSEVTIAGNLKDMFRGIVAIGNDVDLRGGIRTGSILVREMTIAGS